MDSTGRAWKLFGKGVEDEPEERMGEKIEEGKEEEEEREEEAGRGDKAGPLAPP